MSGSRKGMKKEVTKSKTGEFRTVAINLRISGKELELLDELKKARQLVNPGNVSRTDVVVYAVKFALGKLDF